MNKFYLTIILTVIVNSKAFSNEIWLNCSFIPNDGHSGIFNSFEINLKKKTLKMNGLVQKVQEINEKYIVFTNENDELFAFDDSKKLKVYVIDRITGVFNQKFKCQKVDKILF